MPKLPVEGAKKKQKPVPVKIVNDSPKPSYVEEDKKYRAERDLSTLREAALIQADKDRVKAAKACAKEQMKALSRVTGK